MKEMLLVLLIVFMGISVKAQESIVTTFHRMLVFNKENKLLVVKIKDKKLWVTPGLYQNSKQTIKQGIDSIASTYNIKVFDVELRGMYGLKNPSQNYYSTRNIFVMKTDSVDVLLPNIIGEAVWLDVNEAVERISIPHIQFFINDVLIYPNDIRYGTVERFESNGKLKSKISEKFYSRKQF